MNKFIPMFGNVCFKPIMPDSILEQESKPEKGEVISFAKSVTGIKKGDIIVFPKWLCEKYDENWIVKAENIIGAYEQIKVQK
jgi:hypothetical protein